MWNFYLEFLLLLTGIKCAIYFWLFALNQIGNCFYILYFLCLSQLWSWSPTLCFYLSLWIRLIPLKIVNLFNNSSLKTNSHSDTYIAHKTLYGDWSESFQRRADIEETQTIAIFPIDRIHSHFGSLLIAFSIIFSLSQFYFCYDSIKRCIKKRYIAWIEGSYANYKFFYFESSHFFRFIFLKRENHLQANLIFVVIWKVHLSYSCRELKWTNVDTGYYSLLATIPLYLCYIQYSGLSLCTVPAYVYDSNTVVLHLALMWVFVSIQILVHSI